MHGRKECQNLIVKLSSAHSQVAKSLKAQLLQDAPFSKQKHCHTAHVAHKQASLYGMRYP